MQCVVLGASGSQPGNGQPCSGYLVLHGDTRLLVDCGFGVATALSGVIDVASLDAFIVTHRHLDHCIDLLGLYAMVRRRDTSIPVHAADGTDEALSTLITPNRIQQWRNVLPMHPLAVGDVLKIGTLTISAHLSDHTVPTVSLRIVDSDGHVLAYSSDSSGGGDLVACLRDADVALVEASWQTSESQTQGDGHMTAQRAAQVASEAGVTQLVLTHLRPHLDPAMSLAEASAVFDGPVTVARSGAMLTVPADSVSPSVSKLGQGLRVDAPTDQHARTQPTVT